MQKCTVGMNKKLPEPDIRCIYAYYECKEKTLHPQAALPQGHKCLLLASQRPKVQVLCLKYCSTGDERFKSALDNGVRRAGPVLSPPFGQENVDSDSFNSTARQIKPLMDENDADLQNECLDLPN